MLTPKQHELLLFIDQHLRETGCSPSFEEMKEALDLRSKSGIHRLISALEERGFLRRHKHRARALEVTRLPQDLGPRHAGAKNFTPNVIQGNFGPRLPGLRAEAMEAGAVSLPLYGKIAAGLPIEALRDSEETIEVPMSMLGGGEHFALTVEGDSMIEAGILDGDTVIIRRGETADNGQIIVALVDENEVTLKRLRRKGQSIALEPANIRHETRIFPAERVRVQGRLVALLRQY
ncbi:MAG: transcriptional repressor LexA [Proteobacteria bacterium]|nr:transcriptional repressor LexA [Pseudomonadota bacterium]MBU6425610.1 transcriptional repressor LexA [Rhodospirillales bacterium]MBU6426551.1 transcriptional repressor LexA [Rhodospirillales bacterium]MDE2239332.1 transcriptional repressor LexA [Rhodospirillales bacterium]